MRLLWAVSDFLRGLRRQMRFGELSRSPLRLLSLELRGELARCEWMARACDPWDRELAPQIGRRHQTLQALQDAMRLREMLFAMLSEVRRAEFRVYCQRPVGPPELVIVGTVDREDEIPPRVKSLVMRAKLCGLQFSLRDGILEPVQVQVNESGLEFATN